MYNMLELLEIVNFSALQISYAEYVKSIFFWGKEYDCSVIFILSCVSKVNFPAK